MTEASFLWPSTGSGDVSPHSVSDSAALFAALIGALGGANSGIIPGAGTVAGTTGELEPTVSGTNLLVAVGWAVSDGHPYRNNASKTVTPALPSTGVTGRRLVLRTTWAGGTQTVRLTELTSADGTATIPSMTQTTGTTYDTPICSYTVANGSGAIASFHDDREFIGFNPSLANMRNMGGVLGGVGGLSGRGRVQIIDWRASSAGGPVDGSTTRSVVILNGGLMFTAAGTNAAAADSGSVAFASGIATFTTLNGGAGAVGMATLAPALGGSACAIHAWIAPNMSPWMRMKVNPTSGGDANVTTRVVGFGASITAGAMATMNGAYWRRNTTGNWNFVCRQGGAESATDFGAQSNAERWYDSWTPDAGTTWWAVDHTGRQYVKVTTNVPTPGTGLAALAMVDGATASRTFAMQAMAVSIIDS